MKPAKKEKSIAVLFLILLVIYSCSIVLYKHSHMVRGCIIVHLHPYQGNDIHHHHDFNEINFYPLLSEYESSFLFCSDSLVSIQGKEIQVLYPLAEEQLLWGMLDNNLLRAPPEYAV